MFGRPVRDPRLQGNQIWGQTFDFNFENRQFFFASLACLRPATLLQPFIEYAYIVKITDQGYRHYDLLQHNCDEHVRRIGPIFKIKKPIYSKCGPQ